MSAFYCILLYHRPRYINFLVSLKSHSSIYINFCHFAHFFLLLSDIELNALSRCIFNSLMKLITFFDPDFLSAMFGWILLNAFGSFSTLHKSHEVLINTISEVRQKIHSKGEKLYWLSILSYFVSLFVKKHTGK